MNKEKPLHPKQLEEITMDRITIRRAMKEAARNVATKLLHLTEMVRDEEASIEVCANWYEQASQIENDMIALRHNIWKLRKSYGTEAL